MESGSSLPRTRDLNHRKSESKTNEPGPITSDELMSQRFTAPAGPVERPIDSPVLLGMSNQKIVAESIA